MAFLVGVSQYTHLQTLPGVDKDLDRIRDVLLNRGGFDRVYIARGAAATPAVVQHYMMDLFHDPASLGPDDRLFFFYSGHGDDAGGNNPFIQFASATPGSFGDSNVLPVDSYLKWSSRILAKHALFVFDACLAGEVIKAQSGGDDRDRIPGLLATLSGKGSRTLVTAGTFGEKTWYAEIQAHGTSVFTDELLQIITDPKAPALMTIDEIVGKAQLLAADFAQKYKVPPAIPQLRQFDSQNSPGRFVFLNAMSKNLNLPAGVAETLNLKPKGSIGGPESPTGTGTIEVYSVQDGTLLLDGRSVGPIQAYETRRLLEVPAGSHQVEIQGNAGRISATAAVLAGGISHPAFRSPIDNTGSAPVGTLNVQALAGDIYVDNFKVGHLEFDGTLAVSNVTAGTHQCRSVSPKQESEKTCYANPNGSTDVQLTPPGKPTVIVH